jgi:Lactonase, 7-bladed beta-propeller
MKKLLLLSLLLSSLAHAQILTHSKEIGLYQTDKKTQFIRDSEMLSPKSADFIGSKLIINALEKGNTLVYNTETWEKETSISHQFDKPEFVTIKDFPYKLNSQSFMGKPVEMIHNKDKMWIPYYRLSWDTNSRQASAIAQVDLNTMQVEKLIPSGSIPKMVKISHDNKILASTHWGDNTVGLYHLKDNNITSYDYIVIDKKLDTSKIGGDRDSNCGWCLRGTVFTDDDKYLLIGKMGGGGIAVVDVVNKKYIGTIRQVPPTPRHLVLSKDTLYISTVASGEVAKISMGKINEEIEHLKSKEKSTLKMNDWKTVKMGSGVRTLALSKDEKYIYAAMNSSSELGVVDNETMKLKEKYKVTSFPVGLAVSDDDKYIVITSQGKESRGGGNHVDVFERK